MNFKDVPRTQAQLDAPSDWRPGGWGFNPRRGRQQSFVEIDHEIFSTVILSLPLIQEGQFPYLKCPQRKLYSAWKIADIYLRRSAEYWDALSASLRKLEIFSVRTSAIFPYAGPQLSAERSAEVCGHQCGHLRTSLRTSMRMSVWIGADVRMDWCGRPHGLVRTSAWIGADVRMDGCGCLRTSAWMGADIRRARGSVRVAPPAVK